MPLSSKRVLVAEDDQATRDLLRSVLTARGLDVDAARDGREAIALLQSNSYAVVLLDLVMPVADGFAVLSAIEKSSTPSPVVLVLTGADHAIVDRLDSRLIHGIVRKPYDAQEVAGLVATCTEIRMRGAFEAMAFATVIGGAGLLAFLSNSKI